VKPAVQLVWFKRDLRVVDHAPLTQACARGAVVGLYVFEPELLALPDCAVQHSAFVLECLTQLRDDLHRIGIPLLVKTGAMPEVLAQLQEAYTLQALHSHEETGNAASYARDIRVAAWCRAQAIPWIELPAGGVVRRLKSRDQWSRIWMQRMQSAPLPGPAPQAAAPLATAPWQSPLWLGHGQDKAQRQRGGRSHALALLDSFLHGRGNQYRVAMSSPLSAQSACSRLSPHLAYGTVSVREVVHAVWQARREALALPEHARAPGWLASLKSFESRLHWHCHFIQKLESDPGIEVRNLYRAYDGLREAGANPALHAAWAAGETGIPMVDACMRMLHATGWVNFRMRAMLVSFSSYQLWQPWQTAAQHLAREFLDYEPGIHYSQCQMQSGTTGINAIRIYNPVKQAHDHDPQGEFVRQWIPQLKRVPDAYIFEPWRMTAAVQAAAGCVIERDYPAPVVDHEAAARHARDAVWAVRREGTFKQEAGTIYRKHGSRNPAREGRSVTATRRRAKPAVSQQLSLELDQDA
jgi:deoxyribodipyrimidine photo-lyase